MEGATAAAFGLFGRDDALQLLKETLAHGGSVVVTGEPGSGKSSLLKVADQLGQRGGRRVLSVTPTEFDRGLPFAGLAELISQCPARADQDLPGPQQRALDVALRRIEPHPGDRDPLALPLAVRSVLTRLCEAEPLTLVVDDLQWLDQASIGSLAFALRRICVPPERLSVVVGTRPTPEAVNDLVGSLPAPRRETTLRPLEDWAIGQILRARLGPRWTPPVAGGVARACSGNPFLALMVAQAMQSDVSKWSWSEQDGQDPVFPVPPSLVGLLGEKVTLLPASAREVLLLVSAAGRLTTAQLEQVVDPARVRAALSSAADWDIAGVGAGSVVAFTHPLLASAIYEDASPAQRRRAHAVLADLIEDPVERARHRARTISAPDAAVAEELARAAGISRSRGAPKLAGDLWEGAALATPGDSSSPGLERWLSAVDAFLDAGDRDAADAALTQGSALATAPEQQAHVLVRRLRMADQTTGIRDLAEAGLRLAPEGTEVRAEILRWLGTAHRMYGSGDEALRVIRTAAAAAAAVHRHDLELVVLNEQLAIESHWGTGDPRQTVRDIESLAAAQPDQLPPTSLAWTRGFFAAWDDPEAEGHVRQAISVAVEAGRYGDLAELSICLVLVLIRSSRVRDAAAALEEADRLGAWASSTLQEEMARALVNAYTGELDIAREVALRAVERSQQSGAAYWTAGFLAQLGFIEVSAGRWTEALAVLRRLAGVFADMGMVDLEQLLWGVDYADAAFALGATDDVVTAIAVLRRQGEAGRPEATVAARRCAALMNAARGDVEGALHELVALVDPPGIECPFEAARSRLALGQVYRRGGYKGMAHQTLTLAADRFEELGVPLWAERARQEAGRVGLHASTSRLTETERRVAELVGSGHSNQETAAELFMSVKTVEANLTRIYRKLSVRSRTELANHLNQLDPPVTP